MASYRSTKSVGFSINPEVNDCMGKLIDLNKQEGIPPFTKSEVVQEAFADKIRTNLPRLRKNKIAIPASIKPKK